MRRATPRSRAAASPAGTRLSSASSAAEIIEADLWQQYNELAGIHDVEVPGGSGNEAYTDAVEVLDEDMAQYIHDNTDDEFSHVAFINAYLMSNGENPVDLDQFRTLPSSQANGAQKTVGRLTNLMQLTVDTSFWTRYRSDTQNPDLGDTLPQAIPTLAVGQHPAIPGTTLTPPIPTTCRRSPIRPVSTSPSSRGAVQASTPRWPSGSPVRRCFGSCSASAAARSCTSRPGKTKPAMHLP